MTHLVAPRLVTAAALLAAAPLLAQPTPATLPDSGARVRVVLDDRARVTGTLVARGPDRWVVIGDRGDTLAFAPLRLAHLDVSGGLRSPWEAIGRGAWAGLHLGTGATAVAVLTTVATTDEDCDGCIFTPGQIMMMYGMAFTVWATILGGVIGPAFPERWERVPLLPGTELGVMAMPTGAGLVVRVALP